MAKKNNENTGKGSKDGLQLFPGRVTVEENQFVVKFQAKAVKDREPWTECQIRFIDEDFEEIKNPDTQSETDADGNALCVICLPLTEAGKKITIRAEIPGTRHLISKPASLPKVKEGISLEGGVQIVGDEIQVLFVAQTTSDWLPSSGRNVTFSNTETLEPFIGDDIDTETNGDGKAYCELSFPMSQAGEEISVKVEINGTTQTAKAKVKLPNPNKGKQLKLLAGKIKEENGKFILPLGVIVSTQNHIVVEGAEVNFLNIDQEVATTKTTNPEGKAYIEYVLPLIFSGKSITLRARLNGTDIEQPVDVDVPEAKYSGWNGRKILIKRNWAKLERVEFIIRLALITLGSGLIYSLINIFGLTISSVIIAVMTMLGTAALPGRFTLKVGATYGGIVLLVSLLFPHLTAGALLSASKIFFWLGAPLYACEDLLFKKEDKVNIFPWLMLWLCALIALFYFLDAALVTLKGHNEYLSVVKVFLESKAEQNHGSLLLEITHTYPRIQHFFGFGIRIGDLLDSVTKAIGWLIAIALIIIPTSFDEAKRYWDARVLGKGKEFSAEKFGFLYMMFDVVWDRVKKHRIVK